ncbi:helix-turn-helix domain-containing protein [Staphylococcus felis]
MIQYYLSDTSITYDDVAQHFDLPYSQVYRWIQVFK